MASSSVSSNGSRSIAIVDQALLSGFSFLTTLLLLRGMGLESFGMYALLGLGWLWALGLMQALVTQPMQSLLGARVGRCREKYLGACLHLAWGWSLVSAGLATGIVYALDLGAWTAVSFGWFLAARCLQAHQRTAAFAAGDRNSALYADGLGQVGGFLALLFLGTTIGWSLPGVLALQAAFWSLSSIGLSWNQRHWLHRALPWGLVARKQWVFGRWLAGMAAVRWLSANAFPLAIAAQLGPAALGLLRGLQSVLGVVLLVYSAMDTVLPIGAAWRRKVSGDRAARIYLQRYAYMAVGPVLLACAGIGLLAQPILHYVLDGRVTATAHNALLALLVLPLGTLATTLLGIGYRTFERTDLLFAYYSAVALVAALCAPVVVHSFGVVGAAWGIALQPVLLALCLGLHATVSGSRSSATKTARKRFA